VRDLPPVVDDLGPVHHHYAVDGPEAGGDEQGPGERHFLALNSAKAQERLSWSQRLELETAVDWTTEWYAAALLGTSFDAAAISADQLTSYLRWAGAAGTPDVPAPAVT
jgi:hypothetical protein